MPHATKWQPFPEQEIDMNMTMTGTYVRKLDGNGAT